MRDREAEKALGQLKGAPTTIPSKTGRKALDTQTKFRRKRLAKIELLRRTINKLDKEEDEISRMSNSELEELLKEANP